MPGLVEEIEQKPEYLILGAVGVGVALFMLANRNNQPPKVSGPVNVNVTPANQSVDLGTLQNSMGANNAQEQQWILNVLHEYYSTYNGQPPNQAPTLYDYAQSQPPPQYIDGPPQGGGEGPQGAQLPLFGLGGAKGGDGPGAPALTGRRFNSFGIRSAESGF